MSTELYAIAQAKQESTAKSYWMQVLHPFGTVPIGAQYLLSAFAQDGGMYFITDAYDEAYESIVGPLGHITADGVLTFGAYGVWSPYDICAVGDGVAYTALDATYVQSVIFRLDKFNRLQWAKEWDANVYCMNITDGGDGFMWALGNTYDTPGRCFLSKISDADGSVQGSWELSHVAAQYIDAVNVLVVAGVVYIQYVVNNAGYQNDRVGLFAMTTAGVKLWDKTYELSAGWTTSGRVMTVLDGHLYVLSGQYDPHPTAAYHIMKISVATGSLVWAKRINGPVSTAAYITDFDAFGGDIYVCLTYDDSVTAFARLLKVTQDGVIEWQQTLSYAGANASAYILSAKISADTAVMVGLVYPDYLSVQFGFPWFGRLPLRPEGPVTGGGFTWEDTPVDYPLVDVTSDLVVQTDYVTFATAVHTLSDFAVPAYVPGIDLRRVNE